MCQNVYGNIIYTLGASLPGSSVVASDCHCNQLLGTPENMDDWDQEMMQYFQNGYAQLIEIVNPTVIIFKVDKWWLIFTENESWVLSTEILAKQEQNVLV